MGDLGATYFPGDTGSPTTAIKNVVWQGNKFFQMTATDKVLAGQVVEIDATGLDLAVNAAVAESGGRPIGVAINTVAAGEQVTIAGDGCIVYVVNSDDAAAIEAGDILEANDAPCKGAVSIAAVAATGGATATYHGGIVGVALEAIAVSTGTVGSKGRMLVRTGTLTQANSS
jgi:hypothetical protein